MILTLKNIGLIAEMELDLSKQLLVFCGPNNTGKTYASYTLYALHALVHNAAGFAQQFPLPTPVDQLMSSGAAIVDVETYLSRHQAEILALIAQELKQILPDVFASTKKHFDTAEVELVLTTTPFGMGWLAEDFRQTWSIGAAYCLEVLKVAGQPEVTLLLVSGPSNSNNHLGLGFGGGEDTRAPEAPSADLLTHQLRTWIAQTILSRLLPRPFIIPAERIAIQLFAREMSLAKSRAIDQFFAPSVPQSGRGKANKMSTRAYLYPLPVRDALALTEDMTILIRTKSSLAPLATWLEKTVLEGEIGINKDGEMDYLPANQKKAMPLHTAASMVKSLAMLVLYLRHIARPGDLLILDEPELNLHPNNQLQLARLIGRLVHSGVRVLMTTHSDYLIRELNNMTTLQSIKAHRKALMTKYDYSQDELIDYRQIGAYAFGVGTGERPSRLIVEPDGFAVPTLDVVTNSLNLASDEISFYLGQELDEAAAIKQ